MRDFLVDFRIAARTLLKARGFTTVVVATLALAIALETSLIAVVNAYMVRELPYPAASRLYNVQYAEPGRPQPRNMERLDWDSLSDVIEHPIAWDLDVFYMIGGDHPESAPGAWVTPDFMQGFGVRAGVGRAFAPDEFRSGSPQVAMIGHGLWQSRFGGDPAIAGRQFQAYVSDRPDEAEAFTIIGVLPENFWHVNPYTQVFAPLRVRTYPYMVRLRDGIPAPEAERRITGLVGQPVKLRSVQSDYVTTVRPVLFAVGAAATIVLLIASANVAFLMLIRSNRRQKDVAVRLALGAGHGRVARLLVTESLFLCFAGAAIGAVASAMVLRVLAPIIQQQLGRRIPGGVSALSLDPTVFGAVALLALLIATFLTLAPLIVSVRRSLSSLMPRGKQGGVEGLSFPSTLNPPLIQPVEVVRTTGSFKMDTGVMTISAGYFDMFGLRLVEGRPFASSDRGGAERVVIISETLARRLWPETSAPGNQLRVGRDAAITRTVVGVVTDVRQAPSDLDLADLYIPLLQEPGRFATMSLRTNVPSGSWAKTLRTS